MKEIQTFITIDEMRDFYKEKCEEINEIFSEEKFANFVEFCEIDFFDWLKGNWRYFNAK